MQVLTYFQPHATLHALGAKTVETRSMDTKHRGWTAIHAARHTPTDWREQAKVDPFLRVLTAHVPGYQGYDSLPSGAIIGVYWLAAVTDAVKACYGWKVREGITALPGETADYDDVPMYETAFGDYSTGRKAWWTTLIYQLPEPIPCPGLPGLWDSRLLHEGYNEHRDRGADPTELLIRRQMFNTHGIDITRHAMDDPALWRLVNRRGTLGHVPTLPSQPTSQAPPAPGSIGPSAPETRASVGTGDPGSFDRGG